MKYKRSSHKKKTNGTVRGVAASRLQQVSELLQRVLSFSEPADLCVSRYFREHSHLGARDRAQIAPAVFDVLRHLRRYRHDAQLQAGKLEELLAARGLSATLDQTVAASVIPVEFQSWVQHCEAVDSSSLAGTVRFSLPEWIYDALTQLDDGESYAESLLRGAPLDIRVNSLKGSRDDVLQSVNEILADTAYRAEATTYASLGIRLTGHPPINRWHLYEQGVIEVQDEGSQLLSQLVGAKRGEMVIDFCAGAGGKTLALGAMMRSTGTLYAFDISTTRLARAKPRFARSGLSNIHPVAIRHERDDRVARLRGKAHRVLVDAPCTGLGTLRRNPDLKWRQSPEQLARLQEQQASILSQAATTVRDGGVLVYATCSFLREENEQQVEQFLALNPAFELQDARERLPEVLHDAVDQQGMLRLRPDRHGTDGFFAAIMRKK